MTHGLLQWKTPVAIALGLLVGCAAGGARLVGTVAAVSPETHTLTVRHTSGETAITVDTDTHFWAGSRLEQINPGDRVSIQTERHGDLLRARSIQIFPAGRPRTRWIGPGGY